MEIVVSESDLSIEMSSIERSVVVINGIMPLGAGTMHCLFEDVCCVSASLRVQEVRTDQSGSCMGRHVT